MPFDYVKLRAQLIDEEGLKLKPYDDGKGKITIGVGRNLTDNGLTEPEAIMLLANDVRSVVLELDSALPWWKTLDDVRSRVVVSMAFNMGVPTFLTFKRFLAALKIGDYTRAALEMRDSEWYGQVGRRGPKLIRWMITGKSIQEQP